MDPDRFDRLSRALVAAPSRRRVLRLLAAGAVTAWPPPRRAAAAEAADCSRQTYEECLKEADEFVDEYIREVASRDRA